MMLACGGTKGGKRLVTESCTFMWHESRGGDDADLTESEEKCRRVWKDWMVDYTCLLMARYVKGKTSKFWQNITNKTREHWLLGGQQIIDAGIADALFKYSLLPASARKTKPVVISNDGKLKDEDTKREGEGSPTSAARSKKDR